MTRFQFILKSFRHYFKSNLAVAMGIAISTAVITGALMVGDSVKYSLEQTVHYRLGNITHTITAGDRYFSKTLANGFAELEIESTAILQQEATASASGGQLRLPKVNVWGIDADFNETCGTNWDKDIINSESIAISENMAKGLNLAMGDVVLLRIEKASTVPLNAPFVSGEVQVVTYRTKVGAILGKNDLGRLSMKNVQTAPFNVFMPITTLSELMELDQKINLILLKGKGVEMADLEKAIEDNFTLADAGLSIRPEDITSEWELTSERVFIEEHVTEAVVNNLNGRPILTYFANTISSINSSTPYSFVSSLNDDELDEKEIIINQWLANDLKVNTSDSIEVAYFEIGPLRQLTEKKVKFKVKEIVPIEGRFNDPQLMPHIPGFSDANNCRDWDTGVPIELDAIRDKDEDYWSEHRGLPKAFIAHSTALSLWSNRFGNATAVRFNRETFSEEQIEIEIQQVLNPFNFDVQINPVRENGMYAASNGTDFGELFIGLSFFILVAGLLLTAMLFLWNVEQRSSQIGTLQALGISKKSISGMLLSESLLVAVVGIVLGSLLAIAYNQLVFFALNQVWYDIVRTNVLEPIITSATLLKGGIASLVISILTLWLALRKKMKASTASLQRQQKRVVKQWVKPFKRVVAMLLTVFAAFLLASELSKSQQLNAGLFFMAGGILLIALLLFADLLIKRGTTKTLNQLSIFQVIRQNMAMKPSRSLAVVMLLAIGTYLTVSTGLNRQDLFANAHSKSSGTGGFLFYAESTIPVLHDLNNAKYKKELGVSEEFSTVPFFMADGDDASCLNLNKISNPRIIATDAEMLNDRFTFQTKTEKLDLENPWQSLKTVYDDVVPAIADQTVIQWGLGKKVGDTLTYKNSLGSEVKLLLIGGLAPSIFQGSIIIDAKQFLKHFPASSGANLFLIEGKPENAEAIADELQLLFRDFGWQSTFAAQRLAEFKSIENTYLSIFLVLGAFGLLIGTIGLAVVLIRSLLERKSELALLSAVGFGFKKILRIIISEYALLFSFGVAGGFVTAIVSTLPALLNKTGGASFQFPLFLIALILVNGFVWIILLAAIQLRKMKLVEGLRSE